MLTYDMTKRRDIPLYIFLYESIRDDILADRLSPGEKLPSKRSLADHLNVGVITVANAYAQLESEGYIEAEEKRGYFVRDISGFRKGKKSHVFVPEEPEKEYFADFKANRSGICHFPTSTWSRYMREALSMPSLLKTVPYKGLLVLRTAIAEYLAENRGMFVSPYQVIIGAGTEYLYSRLLQLFGRGCTFAVEDPGYQKFAKISHGSGALWKAVPIDEMGLNIEQLELSEADVVHVSPANHFPTGIVMPNARRAELLEWVNRARKRYIIEDDYDCEFRYSGKNMLPLYAEDSGNKVVYINTFSKSMIPSLRISYMILPPELLDRYEQTMSFYSCTVSSFEQYALARFISEGHFERHINHLKNYYRQKRAQTLETIAASPLSAFSRVVERHAGTHFLLEVNTVLTGTEIRRRAQERELSVSLVSDYSYTIPEAECRTLVINYAGVPVYRLTEAVDRLAHLFPECIQ